MFPNPWPLLFYRYYSKLNFTCIPKPSLFLFLSRSLFSSLTLSLSLFFFWSSYYLIFYYPTGQVVLTHACDEALPSIFAIHIDLRSSLSAAVSTPRRFSTLSLFFQSTCHWFNHNNCSSFQSALIFSVLISSHIISLFLISQYFHLIQKFLIPSTQKQIHRFDFPSLPLKLNQITYFQFFFRHRIIPTMAMARSYTE